MNWGATANWALARFEERVFGEKSQGAIWKMASSAISQQLRIRVNPPPPENIETISESGAIELLSQAYGFYAPLENMAAPFWMRAKDSPGIVMDWNVAAKGALARFDDMMFGPEKTDEQLQQEVACKIWQEASNRMVGTINEPPAILPPPENLGASGTSEAFASFAQAYDLPQETAQIYWGAALRSCRAQDVKGQHCQLKKARRLGSNLVMLSAASTVGLLATIYIGYSPSPTTTDLQRELQKNLVPIGAVGLSIIVATAVQLKGLDDQEYDWVEAHRAGHIASCEYFRE